jgi:threonine/homoserine/homoserine lactone efflux protein
VLAQATGFAFLAAISPTALLVMAVFLSSAEPRRNAIIYTAGAVVVTVTAAVAALFVLRAAHLELPSRHDARYDLRLALGVLALAAAAALTWRRRAAPARAAEAGRNLISRLTAQPSPRTAFTAGLIVFAPSLTFLAAVQVVATANTGPLQTIVGLLVVSAVCLLLVWLPLFGYLAAPDKTTDTLARCNRWLRAHGWEMTVWALVIGGLVLVVNGALGLTGVL